MPTWLIVSLLGLVGVCFTILSKIYISRRNARREAGRKLIKAFANEIAILDANIENKAVNVDYLLRTSIKKHKAAIINFRPHLYFWETTRFDKAWVDYYGDGDERCQNYLQYVEFGSNPDARKIFKDRVDAILKFAKQK